MSPSCQSEVFASQQSRDSGSTLTGASFCSKSFIRENNLKPHEREMPAFNLQLNFKGVNTAPAAQTFFRVVHNLV